MDGSIATQFGWKGPLHSPVLFLAKGFALVCGEYQRRDLAVEDFEKAITLTAKQSALSFELAAGLELARFWISRVKSEKLMISLDLFTAGLAKVSERRFSC